MTRIVPAALSGLAVVASVSTTLAVRRCCRWVLQARVADRPTGWSVADDFSQAVAAASPHEGGALTPDARPER